MSNLYHVAELVLRIALLVVDREEAVSVEVVITTEQVDIRLIVADDDVPAIIGEKAALIHALRSGLSGASSKAGRKFNLNLTGQGLRRPSTHMDHDISDVDVRSAKLKQ